MPARSLLQVLKVVGVIDHRFIFLAGLAMTALAQAAPAQGPAYKVEETELGPWNSTMRPDAQTDQLFFTPLHSPRGEAVSAEAGLGFLLKTFRPYLTVIPRFALSADGHHVAYTYECVLPKICIALDGHSQSVLAGGNPDAVALALSADGKHLAYGSNRENHLTLVVDGKLSVEDGQQSQDRAIIGGMGEGGLTFSPDGMHLAYSAGVDRVCTLVVDGRTTAQYDGIVDGHPIFSSDSKRIAFVAETKGKWALVVDGVQSAPYDRIWGFVFSADSRRVAYAVRRGKKWSPVVDGRLGEEYDDILGPVFSPDSQRVAYAVKRDKRWSVMTDGQMGENYENVSSLAFSPDSKRLAYAAAQDKRWMIVVDGRPAVKDAGRVAGLFPLGSAGVYYGNHHVEWSPKVIFIPDSSRIAYTTLSDKGVKSAFSVVLDGKADREFGDIGFPVFSLDGKHIAYQAQTALFSSLRPKWAMVVDGRVGEDYSLILGNSPTFSPDGSLEFLAVKGAEIIQLDSFTLIGASLYRVKYTPRQ
jgi:WD40 repeat protein